MKSLNIKKFIPAIVLLLVLLGTGWNLFKPGYFSMHDDIQVMRLYEMEKCFRDGQIPCRWVPDMGAGFGYPLYNFYSVFPYFLGMFFRLLNFSYVNIVKILFALSLVLASVFMYLLAKEFFGRLGALVAAVFLAYAPYHAVDIYVRGALAESWAIAFFPLIFLAIYRFIKEEKPGWFILSVLSLSGLCLSHNGMTLLFFPLAFLWAVYWLLYQRKFKIIFRIILLFIWSLAISSFFLLPAFGERLLVNINSMVSDYYNFRHHFVSLNQLFISRFWGYGASFLGTGDEMSFQLGWLHWGAVAVSALLAVKLFFNRKRRGSGVIFLMGAIWLFSVFMTHAKSVLIWEAFPLLAFLQFPWRILGISMFAASFLSGSLVSLAKPNLKIPLAVLFFGLVVGLNIGYFRPSKTYPLENDQYLLTGENWRQQSMGALLDYLPKDVKEIPKELAPATAWAVGGKARITEFSKRSDFWRFTIEVAENKPALVMVPVFNFPGWEVFIDQNKTEISSDNSQGLISLSVPPGKHTVVGWFRNTPGRSLANLITLISSAGLAGYFVLKSLKKAENEKNI